MTTVRRRVIPLELQFDLGMSMPLKLTQVQGYTSNTDKITLGKFEGIEVYDILGESINQFIAQANKKFDHPQFLSDIRRVDDIIDGIAYNMHKDKFTNFIIDDHLVLCLNQLDINRVRLYNTTTNKVLAQRAKILEILPDITKYREIQRQLVGDYSNYKYNLNGFTVMIRVNNDDYSDIQIIPEKMNKKIEFKELLVILKEVERVRMEDEGRPALECLEFAQVESINHKCDNKNKKIEFKELLVILKEVERVRMEDEGRPALECLEFAQVESINHKCDNKKFKEVYEEERVFRKEDLKVKEPEMKEVQESNLEFVLDAQIGTPYRRERKDEPVQNEPVQNE